MFEDGWIMVDFETQSLTLNLVAVDLRATKVESFGWALGDRSLPFLRPTLQRKHNYETWIC